MALDPQQQALLHETMEMFAGEILGAPLTLAEDVSGETVLLASICIEGPQNRTLELACSRSASRCIAQRSLDEEQVDEADELESLAELANVIGGNLKGAYEALHILKLPHARWSALPAHPKAQIEARCAFSGPFEGLLVATLLKNTPDLPIERV